MCGIVGIVEIKKSSSEISLDLLSAMCNEIIHRGPDSEGQWAAPGMQCGLGFRRLSIIDLSENGNQPMVSGDGKYAIAFNGEVYDHETLRNELIALGYSYRSRTDTETILNGYRQFGADVVGRLHGMWSFAIWDDERKELFASRDRIGKKPFYYYYKDGLFVFGSEIKSILKHPAVKAELNIDELPKYMNLGMSGAKETLFKGIHKLPPAHFLRLKPNGDLEIRRYWNPMDAAAEPLDMSEKEIGEEILNILRSAIKDRMMSDVPFGVFLSGGIDSSVNVALMAELMTRPIDTFTVGFKELEQYNELGYARQISELFHTNHHEILIDSRDAFPILEELPWYEDEPNGDPVCIPLYFLSKLTRDSGTTVVQVGEGSDEQFMGYTAMLRDYNFYNNYFKKYRALPGFLREAGYAAAKAFLRSSKQLTALEYIRKATKGEDMFWGNTSIFSPSHQAKLFADTYSRLASVPAEYGAELNRQVESLAPGITDLQRIALVEFAYRLPEMLLMRVDKIGMAHSIEARVPFLDYRLVEFGLRIPKNLKVPDKKTTKSILKKAVESILPMEIIYRRKQGFWAPVNEWFRNEWATYTRSKILGSPLLAEGIFNFEYVKRLIEAHESGAENNGLRIYNLLQLAIWHERFLE